MISAITALASTLVGPLTGLLSEFIEDKDKAKELATKVATMAATQAHEEALAQIEVNKAEAQHSSGFVAGWRPFTGWLCASAIGANYIAFPLLSWGARVAGVDVEALPIMDLTVMLPVLGGMLGLGYFRTEEKKVGVARNSLR